MNRNARIKLVRVMTVPISIKYILDGQLRYLGENGFEVTTVSADGPEVPFIVENEKCQHKTVPFTRKITPLTDLACLVELVSLFRELKPQIVHTQTPKAGLLGMIAAWIARVPVRIHTVAGLPLMEARGFRKLVLTMSEKITYRFATRVYSNSMSLREYLHKAFGLPKDKTGVIGNGSSNGIDTLKFSRNEQAVIGAQQIRRLHGIMDDELVFCFVGRLVKDKGVQELVDAFTRLKAGSQKLRLILLGHFESDLDPLDENTRAIIESDERIVSPGFRSEVSAYMAASDVFVFPSYREGFPNVVLQACAMELPSIVTDINGSNEIIRNGDNGLIVKTRDVEGLYEAMKLLSTDVALRKSLGGQARSEVVRKFDKPAFLEKLKKEYKTLIDEHVPAHR